MPVYENRCEDCGHEFETVQSIKDEKRPPCPHCKSKKTKRLISKSTFHLKGDGWTGTGGGS